MPRSLTVPARRFALTERGGSPHPPRRRAACDDLAAGTETRRAPLGPGMLFALALTLALAAAGCDGEAPGPAPNGGDTRPAPPANWPMFHATPDLRGAVAGHLPDALVPEWTFETEGPILGGAAVAGGRVYVGSGDFKIYALDLATGRKIWAHTTEGEIKAVPLVLEGTVYVGSTDSRLYALAAEDGSVRWTYETDDQIAGAANYWKPPDGGGYRILVAGYDAFLHCLDAADGKVLWKVETGNYINGTPAVGDGLAVFGGCDGLLHVVDLAEGKETTTIDAQTYIAASPAMAGGLVYAGNVEGMFMCANPVTRWPQWKYTPEATEFFATPAVGETAVFVGGRDKRLHAIDRRFGDPLWTFATRGDVDSSPVLVGEKVLFGSGDGRLYMVRTDDGTQVWSYDLGAAVLATPAVAGRRVVIGTDDGVLHCFTAKSKQQ